MSTAKTLNLEAKHPREEKSVKSGIWDSSFLLTQHKYTNDSLLERSLNPPAVGLLPTVNCNGRKSHYNLIGSNDDCSFGPIPYRLTSAFGK